MTLAESGEHANSKGRPGSESSLQPPGCDVVIFSNNNDNDNEKKKKTRKKKKTKEKTDNVNSNGRANANANRAFLS